MQGLAVLGAILLLGGVGHTLGVMRFYVTTGFPEVNRIMLDVWMAEAQLLGGSLFFAALQNARKRLPWRALATFGAITIMGFAIPMLPVLFSRAQVIFRIPVMVYPVVSVFILTKTFRST